MTSISNYALHVHQRALLVSAVPPPALPATIIQEGITQVLHLAASVVQDMSISPLMGTVLLVIILA